MDKRMSSSIGGVHREAMKSAETIAEMRRVDALQQRLVDLRKLASKTKEHAVRHEADTWAHEVVESLMDSLLTTTVFHDRATARLAARTRVDPRILQTYPASMTQLHEMYRESVYGSWLARELAIEGLTTGFALRSGRSAGAALHLLSLRKGKANALEARVSRSVRKRESSRFTALRKARGRLSVARLRQLSSEATPDNLDALEQDVANLEEAIAKQSEAVSPTPPTLASREWLAALQAQLPKQGALVSYQHFVDPVEFEQPHYAAFVVAQGRKPRVFDLGPADKVDKVVDALLRAMHDLSTDTVALPASRAAFDVLIAPLSEALRSSTELWIAPDVGLHGVPFAALSDGRAHLFETHALRRVEAAPLTGKPLRPGLSRGIQVLFNPQRGEPLYVHPALDPQTYADLPKTVDEATFVSQLFPGKAKQRGGTTATESALYRLQAPSVLHFAGHGLFVDVGAGGQGPGTQRGGAAVHERRSRAVYRGPRADWDGAMLLMAAGDATSESMATDGLDGLATAYELATMDLHGTDLVVLSACESGLGTSREWAGVGSVQQALHIAGAHAVLGTLWRVGDREAFEFMRHFYGGIKDGESVANALRAAQRARMRAGASIAHWAAFMLSVGSADRY